MIESPNVEHKIDIKAILYTTFYILGKLIIVKL